MPDRPENPAGPYVANPKPTELERGAMIALLKAFPARLRAAVERLTPEQLKTRYRNWTIQQIVNHLADSHINAYVRFKLSLTETQPTIKPYNESRWSALEEAQTTDVNISLQLLDAVHHRWLRTVENMHEKDFAHTYYHPEYQTVVSLGEALGVYAWHCQHHLAQIELLRKEMAA
jgi:hypothetical protein